MSLLLYAITDAAALDEPRPTGLDGAPVGAITAGPLTAVVTGPAPTLDAEAMWRYEDVLEALMAGATVLPVRYGTVLDGAAAVRKTLEARRAEYSASLDRVRGAVELGVRGRWPAPPQPAAGDRPASGTDYMRARMEASRRADAVAARVREQLAPHAREIRLRVLPAPTVPVTAAFLVERAGEPAFVSAVSALEAELPETELVCTGPWPAYSFAEDDD